MFRQSRSCSFHLKPRRPFQRIDHNMQWSDRFGNMGNVCSNMGPMNIPGRFASHPPVVNVLRNAPTCASPSNTSHLPLNNPRNQNFPQNQAVAPNPSPQLLLQSMPASAPNPSPQLLLQAMPATAPKPSPQPRQHIPAQQPATPPNISSSEALTPAQQSAARERVAHPNPENVAPSCSSMARPTQHQNVVSSPPIVIVKNDPDEFDEIREPCIAFIMCKGFFYSDRFVWLFIFSLF